MDYQSLDEIGIAEGTDKSFLGQDYLQHYERSFAALRNREFTLIEIGVLSGSSLRMWTQFFPRALIVGVDIDERARRHAANRIRIEIGSQSDPGFLHALCTKFPPAVIIDDGSHVADDVLFSFERLFPALQPGGCYVIEDLHFHAEGARERHIGTATTLPREVIARVCLGLMDDCPPAAQDHGFARYLREQVGRVEIIRKAAFIWKAELPTLRDLNRIGLLAESAPNPDPLDGYAGLVLRQTGDTAKAAEAVRLSLLRDPSRWWVHHYYAHLLELSGDLAGALAALDEALTRAPEDRKDEVRALQARLRERLSA